MYQLQNFLPKFSQISTAVIIALMAPMVNAEYTFGKSTN